MHLAVVVFMATLADLAFLCDCCSCCCRLFEMPSGRLLQRWPAPSLTDADRVWCMYAFVALVYGLLLPLLLLFIKEVHFRGKRQLAASGSIVHVHCGLAAA
jgi:hypothetical protein